MEEVFNRLFVRDVAQDPVFEGGWPTRIDGGPYDGRQALRRAHLQQLKAVPFLEPLGVGHLLTSQLVGARSLPPSGNGVHRAGIPWLRAREAGCFCPTGHQAPRSARSAAASDPLT